MAVAQVRDAAPLFAALGDETRLRLLVRLSSSGPESISRLSATTPVSRQAVTKHLEGYQFSDVDEPMLRGRVAFGLNEHADLGFGGDVNTDGDYAFGVGVSYHFGGNGRHV